MTIAARRVALPRGMRQTATKVGFVLFGIIVVVALFGPFLAPDSPSVPVGAPFATPSAQRLLGTDYLGRDVVSRVLWGGRSVLLLGGVSTVVAYIFGLSIGLFAGYSRNLADSLLMRLMDILLSFPPLIFMLVMITAVGTGEIGLVIGVAVVQMPSIARIMRTATLEQSVRGFVESAVARGESTWSILIREVLPNLASPLAADVGLRLTFSVLIIASVNFLGLGLQPPAADWGLMVAENRSGIALNPASVLGPAVILALLTISLNLIGDGFARALGRSS
jgi:peptide/nickel transport system permease protein